MNSADTSRAVYAGKVFDMVKTRDQAAIVAKGSAASVADVMIAFEDIESAVIGRLIYAHTANSIKVPPGLAKWPQLLKINTIANYARDLDAKVKGSKEKFANLAITAAERSVIPTRPPESGPASKKLKVVVRHRKRTAAAVAEEGASVEGAASAEAEGASAEGASAEGAPSAALMQELTDDAMIMLALENADAAEAAGAGV
jgi:hypothetical protein